MEFKDHEMNKSDVELIRWSSRHWDMAQGSAVPPVALPGALEGMLTFTAGASASRGSMETVGPCQGFHNSSLGQTGLEKKKKKAPPSPSTGQIWRLTSSPGGSRRIAELRERLSCFVCERVENSQQGIGQAEESFSVTALPGHRGAKSGEQHRSHREHLGSRWVLKPLNVIIHRGRSALNSVFA